MIRFHLISLLLLCAAPAAADSFQSWAAKAAKADRAKDAPASIQAWSNALHLWKPTDGKKARAKAHAARATSYEASGELEKAFQDLSAAIKLDAKDPKLAYRRGIMLLEAGKPERALADFYAATKLDLNFGAAFYGRGRAYEKTGDMVFALEDYKAACQLGVKDACAARKSKTASAARPAAEERPSGAASAEALPEEAPTLGKEIIKQDPGIPSAACAKAIDRCASRAGGTYTSCVEKVRTCDNGGGPGCCPAACLKKFKKALDVAGEGQAFREVFDSKRRCD
jgi:tetratricopeptide (TPR) repeat protein